MSQATNLPLSIKNRLGFDDFDNYQFLKSFVGEVISSGIRPRFVVHARKAITNCNPA